MTSDRTRGLIAASYTPMDVDGRVNVSCVDAMAQTLAGDGVVGVFPCGTTGEFSSLTLEERRALCEAWVAAAPDGFRVIQHVGSTCLADAVGLAQHANAAGVDGIASIGPYFFKPVSLSALVEFCAEVAAAAPALPFYYYHLPVFTGIQVSMPEFLETAKSRIPNFAGIKFSEENGVDLARCVALDNGAFEVFFGCDELLLTALSLGCRAAVGSTYGFMAPLYNELIRAFDSGDSDTARRYQLGAIEIVELLKGYGGHRAMKACMRFRGVDCGPVRPPLEPLSATELATLEAEIGNLEFGHWVLSPTRGRAAG